MKLTLTEEGADVVICCVCSEFSGELVRIQTHSNYPPLVARALKLATTWIEDMDTPLGTEP
jgi:hypothetical protein